MQSSGVSQAEFVKQFTDYKTVKTAVGEAGQAEGAAGSIYIEVQLSLSGTTKNGEPYRVSGPVTLRRVNDVPGSTEEQRRWHIQRVDFNTDDVKAR